MRIAAARLVAAGGARAPVSVVDCFCRVDHRPVVVLDDCIHHALRGAVDLHQGSWLVILNESDGRPLARFTLAHELAHIVMGDVALGDDGRPGGSLSRRRGSPLPAGPTRESACDTFAAELLMPAPLIRQAWRRYPGVAALATRFDVPHRAMERRFAELGLVHQPKDSLR